MSRFAPVEAYICNHELTDAWREYYAAYKLWMGDLLQWQDDHLDKPRIVIGAQGWGGIDRSIWGFHFQDYKDKQEGIHGPDKQHKPDGLRFSYRKDYWVPYVDRRGAEWRELLKTVPTPPEIERRLFALGIRDGQVPASNGGFYIQMPIFHDFDGLLIWATTSYVHKKHRDDDPEPAWSPATLSDFYKEKERWDAAHPKETGDES